MNRNRFLSNIVLSAVTVLILGGCSQATTTTNAPTPGDVSGDVAVVAGDLNQNQTTSVQTNMVDESTSALDTSSTVTSALPSSRSASAGSALGVTVTVTHSNTPGTLANGDVVTNTRTWTNGAGETVTDVVTRPHLPSSPDFTSPSSPPYTSPLSAAFGSAQWVLTGTDVRSVNGVTLSSVAVTWTFAVVSNHVTLVSIHRAGENVGAYTGHVKLDTTIYYDTAAAGDPEYLRVVDLVDSNNGNFKLDRMVYAWNLNTTLVGTLPVSSGTLAFNPAETASNFDFWYHSDPSASPAPSFSGASLASYPTLDVTKWTGFVLQPYGPRIADWYKPQGAGAYTRYETITTYLASGNNSIQFYDTTGATVVKTVSGQTFKTASNGTITTTRLFADGITSTVTITPTYGTTANTITGYTIVRGATTYTVAYTFDAAGTITLISVTNSTTKVTHTYTSNTTGGWTQAS